MSVKSSGSAGLAKSELVNKFLLGIFFGAIIFAISITALRGGSRVGIFEICLVISILGFFLLSIPNNIQSLKNLSISIDLIPITYVIVILTPLTFFSYILQSNGASLLELLAYILSALASIVAYRLEKISPGAIAYGIILSVSIYFFYLFITGDIFTEQGTQRWRGGSKNPNQTALYTICSLIILSTSLRLKVILIPSIFLLIIGFKAFSDAMLLGVTVGIITTALLHLMLHSTRMIKSFIWIIFMPLLLIGLFIFFKNYLSLILEIWSEADEGGGRLLLLTNGIKAYLHSPILGHGAGVFSGGYQPFTGGEAHNTLVDLANIGGIILPGIFYFPYIYAYIISIKRKEYLLSILLVTFIFFSFFHFIARHPISWVLWSLLIIYIFSKSK